MWFKILSIDYNVDDIGKSNEIVKYNHLQLINSK